MKRIAVFLAVFALLLSYAGALSAAEIVRKYELKLSAGAVAVAQQGSKAFVALAGGLVSAYEIKDGKLLWTAKVPQARGLSATADAVVVLAGKNLEILSSSTGKSAGKTALPIAESADVQIAPQPVLDALLIQVGDEGLVFNLKSRKVVAKIKGRVLANVAGSKTQSPFWRFAFDDAASAVAVADSGAQEVRLIEIGSGKTLWTTKAAEVEGFPTVAGDWVVAQAPEKLFTFDRKTGKSIAAVPIKSKTVLPGTHFISGSSTVIISGTDRIINQNPTSDRERLDLIVPGRIDLLAGDGTWVYFLYRFTRESDKKDMSVLMGHNIKNAQLYGREPAEGVATGVFAQSEGKFVVELSPGSVHVVEKSSLKDLGSIQTGSPLAGIAADGAVAALATSGGMLIGIDISGLK